MSYLLLDHGQGLVSRGLPARDVDDALVVVAGREFLLVAQPQPGARLGADVRQGGAAFA